MWDTLDAAVSASQSRLDAAISSWLASAPSRIYCGRGCHNCCSLNVHTTLPEARLLAAALDDHQRQAIARHVATLTTLLPGADLKTYLRSHRRIPGGCPLLLVDGSCGVYQHRPLACRALHSTRDNAWCATDFADLHPLERQAFLSSLDPAIVAFPTHYARGPRELGEAGEDALLAMMKEQFGFALSGNLGVLLLAEMDHRLSASVAIGHAATSQCLAAAGLGHPFLVTFHD